MNPKKHAITLVILFMLIMPINTLHDRARGTNPLIQNEPLRNTKYQSSDNGKSYQIRQTGYGSIEIYGPNITTTGQLPSDWFDVTWKYRARVWVNETSGVYRPVQLVTVSLSFLEDQCKVGTIIVVDNSTNPAKIIPSQIWNPIYYTANYYKSVYISWITTLGPNEHKLFYVYWNDEDTGYTYPFTDDKNRFLVYNDTPTGYYIGNKYFESNLYINGGIDISVSGQKIIDSNSFFFQPYTINPSNATYIWLDSTSMANYTGYTGIRDHLKIIAWDDDTRVKVYGYNMSTENWDLLVDVTMGSNELLRYPPSGESPYNLTRVESNKPISIFVTDLGSSQPNSYGVDGYSDDAFYSYFGTRIVLWVPRDLFIASYFDNTHIKIIDMSEGDDTFELTLNKGDVWFHGMGDKRTYYGYYTYYYYDYSESAEPSYFENDIVRVEADKPVTIIGGYISNDMVGVVKGYAYTKYVFPFFGHFSISPLFNDTNINVTLKFYNATSESFEVFKTLSLNLDANESYEVKNDPNEIKIVVAVDLYKNASSSAVPFNVTILTWNATAYVSGQTPYWYVVTTYTGTVTPTATPSKFHYDDPTSGNWNETVITLDGGRPYWIVLGWNGSDDLDLYVYWYGKSPLEDGTGDDYELQVRPNWNLGTHSAYGSFNNDYEAYWYLSTPISSGISAPYGHTVRPYNIELKHEEWGIAIVESDKPIIVYTGHTDQRYENTTRATAYGGQLFYCGTTFDFAFPYQNRYLKVAAIEPDTHLYVWLNGSVADWRSRDVKSDVRVISPNEIVLDYTSSWVEIPLPKNTRIHIESNKPILVKIMHGWSGVWRWDYYSGAYSSPEPTYYNPVYYSSSAGVYYSYARFGYEEISLFVMDPSAPIVSIDKIVEGPIFTKVKISWGIMNNLIVEDEYVFVANSSSILLNRNLRTPEYISRESQITLLGLELTEFWNESSAVYNITLEPYSTLYVGDILSKPNITSLPKDFIIGIYEPSNSLSVGVGLLSISALGYSQLVYNMSVVGYIYEMELSRIYHTGYLQLEGGETNKIVISYVITAGSFGSNIISETKTHLLVNSNPIVTDIGDYESTEIDVTVKIKDLDHEPVQSVIVNLYSASMGVNDTLITDDTGRVVFFDIPAANDYVLRLTWTNSSFEQFPEALIENSSLTINGDTIYEYIIAVKDVYLHIYDGDNHAFRANSYINITGKYYYGAPTQEELVVFAWNILVKDSIVKLDNLPVGRLSTSQGYMKYNISGKYISTYSIETYNFTSFVWDKINTTNTVSYELAVSDLYVQVIDLDGETLPGATAYLFYDTYTREQMTNSSGIALFEYLPHGTYELNAEYFGVNASSNVVIEFNRTKVFNVTVPIKYGTKPAQITISSNIYEGYWGSEITVYAQFIDTTTSEAVSANLTLWVVNRLTGEILVSGKMINVSETLYAFTISLSGMLKAGQSYIIQVHGFSQDYVKPQPANATLMVLSIPIVLEYPDKIEVFWGRNATVWVNVTHTEMYYYAPLTEATVYAVVLKGTEIYRTLTLSEIAEGSYRGEFLASGNLTTGVYSVTVYVQKYGYANLSTSIPFSILTVPTIIVPNVSTVSIPYFKNLSVILWYNRTDIGPYGIEGASAEFKVLDSEGNTLFIGTPTELGGGRYLVSINTTMIGLGSYILYVRLSKQNYLEKEYTISVNVLPITTSVVITPESQSITWGDKFNYTINIIDLVDLEGIENVNIELTVRVGGNVTDVGEAITLLEIGGGTYVIMVESGLLSVGNYTIGLTFSKEYYSFETTEVYLTVNPVEIEVSISAPREIQLNPITGSGTTKIEIALREEDTLAPLIGATVKVNILYRGKLKASIIATESSDHPGIYYAKLDITGYTPGDYIIRVEVESITRAGYTTSSATMISITTPTEIGIKIEYLGGSTEIMGKRYPNLLVYPPLIVVFSLVGFIIYKYYSWYHLPLEVREVITLMRQIEKGIYEYEAPSREEVFKDIMGKELDLT